jgi:hypothetical protein
VVAQRAGMESLSAHGTGCGCGNCGQVSDRGVSAHSMPLPVPAIPVIQGMWRCSECGKTGDGKPKGKCPDCGLRNTLTEVAEGRQPFGTWWDSLDGERKQELLRAHGTHEDSGGGQKKKKGGGPGGKGNQHDDGVARAKQAIKKEYERGDYD